MLFWAVVFHFPLFEIVIIRQTPHSFYRQNLMFHSPNNISYS